MRLSILWRIMEIEEGVIRWLRRPRRITPSEISTILHVIRTPTSIIVLLFIQNNSWFKNIAKTCLPPSMLSSLSVRLGLFSSCLVPRPHYYARPMRFGSRSPTKFLRPRQTRRSETFCLTWGGAFGSGRAVNNFSALMKDVQEPWRVQRIKS